MDIEALVEPVVASAGLDLWDVSLYGEAGSRVLRVSVDREGGVDLDAIAELSGQITRRLDRESVPGGPYSLEVSSPGIEGELREPRHFRLRIGSTVTLTTAQPVDGSLTHRGELVSADAEAATVATEGGELRVPYGNVQSARTVFDWDAERKRRRP